MNYHGDGLSYHREFYDHKLKTVYLFFNKNQMIFSLLKMDSFDSKNIPKPPKRKDRERKE